MKFDVSEKPDGIRVWLAGPQPWQSQTFFPVIDHMLERVRAAIETKKQRIVFDFSSLNFIDSYMIAMLVQCTRFTDPLRNVMVAPDEQVRSILMMLGIDRMMDVYASVDEWKTEENEKNQE